MGGCGGGYSHMLGIRVCEKRQGPVFRFSGCSKDCPTDITEADGAVISK